MLVDSLIVPQCEYRPGSFSGLMTLYESNFIKFDQLTGHVFPPGKDHISQVEGDCDLYLHVLRREPYTSTIKLTYWFDEDSGPRVPDPDLLVRVYHDASLVEAVGGQHHHRHHVLRELAMRHAHAMELDRRWHVNIMLNKWLDFLLENGHSFA